MMRFLKFRLICVAVHERREKGHWRISEAAHTFISKYTYTLIYRGRGRGRGRGRSQASISGQFCVNPCLIREDPGFQSLNDVPYIYAGRSSAAVLFVMKPIEIQNDRRDFVENKWNNLNKWMKKQLQTHVSDGGVTSYCDDDHM